MLRTLNLHSVLCKLYLNKSEVEKEKKCTKWILVKMGHGEKESAKVDEAVLEDSLVSLR